MEIALFSMSYYLVQALKAFTEPLGVDWKIQVNNAYKRVVF